MDQQNNKPQVSDKNDQNGKNPQQDAKSGNQNTQHKDDANKQNPSQPAKPVIETATQKSH